MEQERIREISKNFEDKGVQFIAICFDEAQSNEKEAKIERQTKPGNP